MGNGFYARKPLGHITFLTVSDQAVVANVKATMDALYLSPYDDIERRSISIDKIISLRWVPLSDVDYRHGCK